MPLWSLELPLQVTSTRFQKQARMMNTDMSVCLLGESFVHNKARVAVITSVILCQVNTPYSASDINMCCPWHLHVLPRHRSSRCTSMGQIAWRKHEIGPDTLNFCLPNSSHGWGKGGFHPSLVPWLQSIIGPATAICPLATSLLGQTPVMGGLIHMWPIVGEKNKCLLQTQGSSIDCTSWMAVI